MPSTVPTIGAGEGGIFIKDVEYPTLQEAVVDVYKGTAKGNTITLMRDVAEPGLILPAGVPMTIDFNGFNFYITADPDRGAMPIMVFPASTSQSQGGTLQEQVAALQKQVLTLKNGYVTIGEDTNLSGILMALGNVTLDNMTLDGKHWYFEDEDTDAEEEPISALCFGIMGEIVVKGNSRLLAPDGGSAFVLATLTEEQASDTESLKVLAPKLTIEGKNVLVDGALHLAFDTSDIYAKPDKDQLLHFLRYSQVTTPASMELELSEFTQDLYFDWAKVGSKNVLARVLPFPMIFESGDELSIPLNSSSTLGVIPGETVKATGLPSGIKLVKTKDDAGDTYALKGQFKKAGAFDLVLTISGTETIEVDTPTVTNTEADAEAEVLELDYSYLVKIVGAVKDIELLTEISDPCSSENYPTPNKISVTKGPYTLGKKVTLKATPAAGYTFEKWERYPDGATEADESTTEPTVSFELTEDTPHEFTARAQFSLRNEINEGKLFAAPPAAEGDTAALVEGDTDWNANEVIKLEPGKLVEIPLDETIAETLTIKGFPSGLKLGTTEEGKPAIVGTPKKADAASTLVFTQKSTVKGEPAKVSGRVIIVEPYDEIDDVTFTQNDAELEGNETTVGCGEEIAPISITYDVTPTKLVAKNLPKGLKLTYDKKTGAGTITGAVKTPGAYRIRLTATGPAGDTSTVSFWIYVNHIRQIESLKTVLGDSGWLELDMTQTKGEVVANDTFDAFNTWLAENPTAKVTGLPSGMKVTKDKETGTLSITGAPTKGGSYIITITMEDDNGNTLTTTVDLYVDAWLDVKIWEDYFRLSGGEKAMVHLFEGSPEYSAPTWGALNTNLRITFPDGSKVGNHPELAPPDATIEDMPAFVDLADYTVKAEGLPKGMKLEKKTYTLTDTDTPKETMTTYVITGTPKLSDEYWDEEYQDWWYYVTVTLTHKATGMKGSFGFELSIIDYFAVYRQGTYVMEGYALAHLRFGSSMPWPVRMIVDRPTGYGGTATVYIYNADTFMWEKVATLPFAYNDGLFSSGYGTYTGWYAKGDTRVAFWHAVDIISAAGEVEEMYVGVIDNLEVDGVRFSSLVMDEYDGPDWETFSLWPAGN